MAKRSGKRQLRKGKNQSDLKPIRKAIEKTIADLKTIKMKKKDGPTIKQKAEIIATIVKLELIKVKLKLACCDGQHFCPCPEPDPQDS